MLSMFGQFYSYIDDLPAPWNSIVKILFFIALVLTFIFTNFSMVAQGSVAMKLRFGKVILDKQGRPKLYHPGRLHWVFPKLVKLVPVDILTRQVEFAASAQTEEFAMVKVTGTANLAAFDVFRIEFTKQDFEPFAASACRQMMIECLQGEWQGANDIAYRARVSTAFSQHINFALQEAGANLESLKLGDIIDDPQMAIARALHKAGTAT